MGSRILKPQIDKYHSCREMGMSIRLAAREARVSEAWAKAHERKLRDSSGESWRASREGREVHQGPVPFDGLSVEARRAWDDFEFFRRRYLGHLSTPWQLETARVVVEALESGEQDYVVENCPPGVGKTTLAVDIAAWVTVRDRRIRGLFGSRVENNARRQLRRLRRTLERTKPMRARPEDIARGLAVDAVATLAQDFGSFKPATSDIWKADEFVVAQEDDEPIDEKEPTWSSYGMDSGVLGNRFELVIWDDVVDKSTIRTTDAQENQRLWWDDEAETRLEPTGTLLLIGQRMAASDLYRYCLDKEAGSDEDDDGEEEPNVGEARKYRHIVYKAHYEDRCRGPASHRASAAPWPEGCLLDPYRLAWKKLRTLMASQKRTYAIQYQQEDADPDDVLVPEVWITGGSDEETGELRPGCWDGWRDLCELPDGLVRPLYSIATVDPSGTKMWALQWWIHAPEASNQSFLMDLERKAMPANELLDWDANRGEFYGLMEDWQARSVALGHPIKTWVVEVNAAQRYLLAYDHVRRWMAKWKVSILPHTTGPRKLDETHGPWIIRDHFKFGRVRLPGRQGAASRARIQSLKLVDEVKKWPNPGITDDQVMACWFYFGHLPQLTIPERTDRPNWRPSWMRKTA